ncbi:MAG: MarR family transcriptional regulator [Anaerolineales bacterium]|nr:MarR family transcriptional regulator [Anaerolineales bacterium]
MTDPEMNLYTTFKEIYFTLDNGDRRLLEGYNLSVPRFYLLKHIAENPGITLTQLSTRMLTDKSNITRLIKGVEAEGLVTKVQHETDGRALSLHITESGHRILSSALAAHSNFTQERFAPIRDNLDGLLNNLLQIKQILDTQLDG